jgi:hypothetical membrane protein
VSGLDQISVVGVGYSAVVVVVAVYAVLRYRARPPWLDSMAWFLELLFLVRLAAGIGSIAAGHRPHELTANVGYLIASVCIMPIALGTLEEDRSPWSVAVVAIAAVALGVIGVRTMMTM